MKRSYLFLSIIGVGLASLLSISGCISKVENYQVQQSAKLRVMNFAPNCTAPMDVYWETKKPLSSLQPANAKIHNLKYGDGAVYSSSLAAAASPGTDYYFAITQTATPTQHDLGDSLNPFDEKLSANGSYTLMITRDPSNGNFLYSFFPDDIPQNNSTPDPTMAYVRFINMEPSVGPLSLHVNDAVHGDAITPNPIGFNQVGPYVPIKTALDTSFAFLATNASNQVIARLSYQTFVGGNFYTIIYAGDPCNTVAQHPADTSISALDTFRLRSFDDNSTGNDQTNPIQYSYRYNIVNDIYPFDLPYDQTNNPPVDTLLGFLVNGGGLPEFGGYSINPVEPQLPGGAYSYYDASNSTYDVSYQSAILANPLDVKGFITNLSGTSQRQVFDWSLANPAAQIPSDKPVTLMFYGADTLPKSKTSWPVSGRVVQIPDVSYSDSATLVLLSGINSSPKLFGNQLYTSFFISENGAPEVQPPVNGYSITHAPVVMNFPVTGSTPFTIRDAIGTGSNQVPGVTQTFTAQPGGIYEIISTGIKDAGKNSLLIMQVNAPPKQ